MCVCCVSEKKFEGDFSDDDGDFFDDASEEEDFDSFMPTAKSLFADSKGNFSTLKNAAECVEHAKAVHGFDLKVSF